MIYEFVKDRLQAVEGLQKNVFPTGACIDDVEGAFAVYTLKGRTPVRDLSGDLHHYVEEVMIDFLGELYDPLHELYCQAEESFCLANVQTGHGEFVFSVTCASAEPDALDVNTALLRRSMLVTILWCPAE